MQEIKKRRIVLASVLKPVNDPRMLEKIGWSLAKKYDVHVIGYPANRTETNTPATLHPFAPFKRISLQRLAAAVSTLKKILQLKPSLLIVCTHELLGAALIAKLFTGCRVIYDVQENYWRNILYGRSFPSVLRLFIGGYVRLKEIVLSPFIDHFFLAEVAYLNELSFTSPRRTVLENKVIGRKVIKREKAKLEDPVHLLFSGTLAETTGVFTAIDMATKLHAHDPRITLSIVGYCAMPSVLAHLQARIAEKPFITLTGGDVLVPHEEILKAIETADFGLITYPPNASTATANPTKLFEYLGYQLPVLLTNNPSWAERCAPYPAAISVDADPFDAADVVNDMQTKSFYLTAPSDVFWDSEEPKLMMVVDSLAEGK